MPKKISIGIIASERQFVNSFEKKLSVNETRYNLFYASEPRSIIDWAKNRTIDILLLDYHLMNALQTGSDNLLSEIQKINKELRVEFYHHTSPGSMGKAGNIDDIIRKLDFQLSRDTIEEEELPVDNKSELITDINIVNTEWSKILKTKPELIHELSPRQFEEFIAEIWSKRGYEVQLTPKTRDGGKDIYAYKKSSNCELLFAIECKRYDPANKVGRPIIQQLNGIIESERLTGGIIATTSYFSKDAIEYAKPLRYRIYLNDLRDLREIISNEL